MVPLIIKYFLKDNQSIEFHSAAIKLMVPLIIKYFLKDNQSIHSAVIGIKNKSEK